MGHAEIDNQTQLQFAHFFANDEEGRPLLVLLAQASYSFGRRGAFAATPPVELKLEGELWQPTDPSDGSLDPPAWEDDVVSYRLEPCFAFEKTHIDAVLLGHAYATGGGCKSMQVKFQLGHLQRELNIYGDRVWVRSAGQITATAPQAFRRIPLRYERAFGGWDRSNPDSSEHRPFRANPVGLGFRSSPDNFEEGLRLPNIEDPNQPVRKFGENVFAAGVGFVSPDWESRARYAGSYDEAWQQERMPLLPKDFDRTFFNAASPGLIAARGSLRGGEAVSIVGATPHRQVQFALPEVRLPQARVELIHRQDALLSCELDTLVVDSDNDRLLMHYRAHLPLRDGPHDVRSIELS